jgi:hypothetical protein
VEGLWVSSPYDPLAYLYGYIPGINGGGGSSYFGSGNFDLVPVILTDPTLSLSKISQILGHTGLPAGGEVLDLSAATAAYLAQQTVTGLLQSTGQSTATPEPGTLLLGLGGLIWLFAVLRIVRQPVKQRA